MMALYCADGILSWLEVAENRLLLFHYLKLRAKAKSWYADLAKAYFDGQRQLIDAMLEKPGAALEVDSYLRAETARVEAEIYAMPEKGRFVPGIFAPRVSLEAAQERGFFDLD
ncbi:unnamed protein product [Polarella glacialis]|uniref:Uncharacterized protein n=1 Tax=Polarella glacialis TaxID=89957 RepID=A0A813GZA9_POLGL|nr:unnamed protein product [Polarella glacialis]